jgi:hypothetical protein
VTEDDLGSHLANASWLAALDDFRNCLQLGLEARETE